jgi:hypothetical protein
MVEAELNIDLGPFQTWHNWVSEPDPAACSNCVPCGLKHEDETHSQVVEVNKLGR